MPANGGYFDHILRGAKLSIEGVVAQWYNPLILQPEQSSGVGLSPGRAPPLERRNKGSWTQSA